VKQILLTLLCDSFSSFETDGVFSEGGVYSFIVFCDNANIILIFL